MFRKLSDAVSHAAGSSWTFLLAFFVILVWALSGPAFSFSEIWQLVINTGTTIITFLMVFLIQNTQNRDAKAVHLKLDELLRALHDARTELVDIEHTSDEELQSLEQEFTQMRNQL